MGRTVYIKATEMRVALELIKKIVADYFTKRVTVIRWKTIPVTVFLFSEENPLMPGEMCWSDLFKSARAA